MRKKTNKTFEEWRELLRFYNDQLEYAHRVYIRYQKFANKAATVRLQLAFTRHIGIWRVNHERAYKAYIAHCMQGLQQNYISNERHCQLLDTVEKLQPERV